MFWLKQCARCGGDLYDEKDIFGPYISCVQCGFQKDVPYKPLDPYDLSQPEPSPSAPTGGFSGSGLVGAR